jgi:uncharacterized damage-inducible protein DinB
LTNGGIETDSRLLDFVSRGEETPDAAEGETFMRFPIRFAGPFVLCCLTAAAPTFALAQAAAPAKPAAGTAQTPPQVYGKLLGIIEKEFVSAAEAMPDDKFNFSPTQGEFKGVRSFGDQIKHVTESNYYFFGGGKMTDAEMKAGRDAIEKLTTKADIIDALKKSLTQAHTFVDGITPENAFVTTENGTRAGMASFGIAHMMDHYGQMVVYLRMNGIVPPASRGGNM